MSRHRGIGLTAVVVGVVVLGLGWGSLAAAKLPTLPITPTPPIIVKPVPPTIDQILGTWNVTVFYVEYDLTSGSQRVTTEKDTVTITKIDSQTVQITNTAGTWTQDGSYLDGVLMMGAYESDGDVLTSSATGCFFVRGNPVVTPLSIGKPGHLTANGQWLEYSIDDNYVDIGTVIAQQVATPSAQ